jgi:hypothetical protein
MQTFKKSIVALLVISSLFVFHRALWQAPVQAQPAAWIVSDGYHLVTPPVRWEEVGTITSSQAYPAVGDRDWTTVDALAAAKVIEWTVPKAATGFMLSFQTTANADSTTVALMGFAVDGRSLNTSGTLVDDDALYLGQLALTGGQQVGKHTNVYVDSIVATKGVWEFDVYDHANDRRAVVTGDTLGIKKVIFIATTLEGSSTLYAEARWW